MEREVSLTEFAERIGTALGATMKKARDTQSRIRVVGGQAREQASDRASGLARSVKDRFSNFRQDAAQATSQAKETAREKIIDFNQKARRRVYDARDRAETVRKEYPIQTMLGIAAASFVIGFALRLWRSNRG